MFLDITFVTSIMEAALKEQTKEQTSAAIINPSSVQNFCTETPEEETTTTETEDTGMLKFSTNFVFHREWN